MVYAIVPVKPLHLAKSRLAGVLSPAERRSLVLAMLGDVLLALGAARSVARTGVISGDRDVLELVAGRGSEVLHDRADDLNGAVEQAARHCVGLGARALLFMPGDVPLAVPPDIDALAAALDRPPGVALAPARDGGTNALLASPPLVLPFLFGADSLVRYRAAAAGRGVAAHVVRAPSLELDVDQPIDLLALAEAGGSTASQRLLRALRVADRLASV